LQWNLYFWLSWTNYFFAVESVFSVAMKLFCCRGIFVALELFFCCGGFIFVSIFSLFSHFHTPVAIDAAAAHGHSSTVAWDVGSK
jgi:hypothetical protein